MDEANKLGYPVTRSLFMNFPNDTTARQISDQFMLGDHVIMAPIFKEQQTFKTLYLPQGSWKHIWTNTVYNGPNKVTVYAPLGQPAVFFDNNWKQGDEMIAKIQGLTN